MTYDIGSDGEPDGSTSQPCTSRASSAFAADATAGSGIEVAFESSRIEDEPGAKRDVDDVESLVLVFVDAVSNVYDVLTSTHNALAMQEAGRQLEVVARRAHGDRDVLAYGGAVFIPDQPDLQRLFGGETSSASVR
jgi:hypothetical protein